MHTHSSALSFRIRGCVQIYPLICRLFAYTAFLALACAVSAQTWTPEQQEIWKLEELQWKLAKDKDMSWIEKMVHPNMSYWETGQAMPQNRDSLVRWTRYGNTTDTVLEQELFPVSVVITGKIAVAQYHYQVARENYKKERETVRGHYTDILIKEGDHWLFIAWSGGDDPKK